jgi:hypothetical protein
MRNSKQKVKKKKGLTFNSYVQMKIIDTPHIEYRKLKKVTADDTPYFYSAEERDNNYTRSKSYLDALRGGGDSGTTGVVVLDEDSTLPNGDEEYGFDNDMDASSRSLVSNFSDSVRDEEGKIEKYTNGSELVDQEDMVKDFRQLSYFGTLRVLMRCKLVYFTCLTYFFLVMAASTLNEIFPLWVVIPSAAGGFGFNSTMLSLTLFCSGPVSLVMQLCAFPSVVHHYGLLPLVRNCFMVFFLIVIVLPAFCAPAFQRIPILPQVLVVMSYSVLTVAVDWAMVITYVFLNNSCYAYQRATVNGIAQALSCIAMMIASLGGSSFFALCESNSLKESLPWPFHYAIVFWLIALFGNMARQATYRLHRKIQKVRREPNFPRYSIQMEHFAVETGGAASIDEEDDDKVNGVL